MKVDRNQSESWEQRKKTQIRGEAYFLPPWYVLYGLWVWPLVITLVLVLLLARGEFKVGFTIAWIVFMIALGVYVGILGRRWPIRPKPSSGEVRDGASGQAG